MKDARDYKRILIFRIGHLGDTLVSLPAIWAVRRAFVNAEITLLTNVDSKNAEYVVAKNVLPEKGLIDDWLFFPGNLSKLRTAASFAKLLIDIRRRGFDCVFYLMTRNRTKNRIKRDEKFFKAAGIAEIFGTDHLKRNLIREPFESFPETIESESEFFLNCLPADRFEFDLKAAPDLLLSAIEKEFADDWLKTNCGQELKRKRLIAVAPGSKWESKVWPEDNFAEVVSKLIARDRVFPIVFGGREDRETGNRLLKIWKSGANAAGELNIRQAAAALEKCSIYLGNDTGTMHLAASVGTPCAAIFSAIDLIGRWNPIGENHFVFRERVACEGCHSPVCRFNNECLTNIRVDEVLGACENLLKLDSE